MCGRDGSSTSKPVPETGNQQAVTRRRWSRCLVLIVVAGLFAWGLWLKQDGRAAAWLIEQESRLGAYRENNPLIVLAVALLLYVLITTFSIPVATILSLALGHFLGFWPAVVVVSFGSTIGATSAMLLGRYLFREAVMRRLGDRGARILGAFRDHGAFYLFTLRMMPQAPFFLVNLVMSISPIRAVTFFWVSQVGMLPGTCLYVFAGSRLPTLETVIDGPVDDILNGPLIIGLVLLGCFPLAVRLCWRRWFSENARGRRRVS